MPKDDNFITMNKELPEELRNKLINFQGHKKANEFTLFFKHGVYGDIVILIGDIIKCYDQIPNKENKHLFSLGTVRGEGHAQMTYKIIRILISGFDLNKKHNPSSIFNSPAFQYNHADRWLTDTHIELLRIILDKKNVIPPNNFNEPYPNTSVVLSPHFITKFFKGGEDKFEALNWFRLQLHRNGLLSDHGCFAEDVLIPINLDNCHWILGIIDLKHHCYFAINPYRPTKPSYDELEKVRSITVALEEEFGFSDFQIRSPDFAQNLCSQHHKDTSNCGVYISMYLAIYAFGSTQKRFIGEFLPRSSEQCRFLLLAWLLKGEIFFPSLK
jgi:hypothetical protein